MRKVAAILHAISVVREGTIVVWIDQDVVPMRPIDEAFLAYARQFDVAYTPFTTNKQWGMIPKVDFAGLEADTWRIESGVVAVQAGTGSKAIFEEAAAMYRGKMLELVRSCLDGCGESAICSKPWFRRNAYLDDIYVLSVVLRHQQVSTRQGWLSNGCGHQCDNYQACAAETESRRAFEKSRGVTVTHDTAGTFFPHGERHHPGRTKRPCSLAIAPSLERARVDHHCRACLRALASRDPQSARGSLTTPPASTSRSTSSTSSARAPTRARTVRALRSRMLSFFSTILRSSTIQWLCASPAPQTGPIRSSGTSSGLSRLASSSAWRGSGPRPRCTLGHRRASQSPTRRAALCHSSSAPRLSSRRPAQRMRMPMLWRSRRSKWR